MAHGNKLQPGLGCALPGKLSVTPARQARGARGSVLHSTSHLVCKEIVYMPWTLTTVFNAYTSCVNTHPLLLSSCVWQKTSDGFDHESYVLHMYSKHGTRWLTPG